MSEDFRLFQFTIPQSARDSEYKFAPVEIEEARERRNLVMKPPTAQGSLRLVGGCSASHRGNAKFSSNVFPAAIEKKPANSRDIP